MKRFLMVGLILCSSSLASARGLDLIYKNNEGVRHFKKEKYLESYESFLGLTAQEPYDLMLQYNLGAALGANKEVEKAAALYKQLLRTIDAKLKVATEPAEQQELLKIKFAVLYNLGIHYQLIKEPEEALKYYQLALELLPDSKEIKTNIEMMFQGGGNGKGDPDKKEKGEGEGEGNPDQQDQNSPQPKPNDKNQGQDQQKKGFDQKQMSMEDLERIMDELKQQEQNIRAKVNKKGGKSEPKEKEW